jgi:hypothetical protein
MSEVNHYPNFYEPTEGRPPVKAEQIVETAKKFNEIFDDLMLKEMAEVRVFDALKGRPNANLFKRILVDGQTYNLSLEDKSLSDSGNETHGISLRDSERFTRGISLQRTDKEGYGREFWSYRLGADGTVRRWDAGDMTANNRKEKELGIERPELLSGDESLDEIENLARSAIESLVNDRIPNSRLEEDFGINNQPVTPDEIRGLQEFLAKATYVER